MLRPCDGRGAPSSSSGFARSASRTSEIAILCRTNARLVDFEEALHEAGIPAQGASFLGRESARFVLRRLESPADVRRLAAGARLAREPAGQARRARGGSPERPRRGSSGSPRSSRDLDGPGFVAELERRFGDGGESRRGVHLLTLHGAKGLEFEAVFVARVEEKELPTRLAKTADEIAEERRLFYVGLTRAKRHLFVTWTRQAVALPARARASVARPARAAASPSRTIRSSPR